MPHLCMRIMQCHACFRFNLSRWQKSIFWLLDFQLLSLPVLNSVTEALPHTLHYYPHYPSLWYRSPHVWMHISMGYVEPLVGTNLSLILQANQAGSSSGMEFMAFQEAFTFLLGTGMIIKSFISDRHTSIAKWMREDCPKKCRELGKPVVQHFFDIWHIGKSKARMSCKNMCKNLFLKIFLFSYTSNLVLL